MNKTLPLYVLLLLAFTGYGQKTEKSLREYFENAYVLNPIEGTWKVETTREFYHYDTLYQVEKLPDTELVAIVEERNVYNVYYLNGENFNTQFYNSDVKGVYMYRNYYSLISDYSGKQAVICTHGKMEYTHDLPLEYVVKICGTGYRPNTRVVNILRWNKVSNGIQ